MADYNQNTPDDPTIALLKARIAQRASVNPLVNNIGNGLKALVGSPGTPDPLNSNLEAMKNLNEVQTGTPSFQLQKAQTLANIGVEKDLQTKQLERKQIQDEADKFNGDSGNPPATPPNGPTPPQGYVSPSASAPAFVQGVGQQTPGNVSNNGQANQGDYESVQKPPLRKFQNGVWVNEPQAPEIKPTLAREAENSAAKERGTQSGAVDPLLGTSTGAMRGAIGRFKAMAEANPLGAGRAAGVLNSIGGTTGLNPNVKPYNGLKVEVATELAKIANPSGRGAQATIDQFQKLLPDDYSNWNEASNKIHDAMQNAFVRYHAYKFGKPPTAQDMAGFEGQIQDILNTPATKQATMSGNVPKSGGVDYKSKYGLK